MTFDPSDRATLNTDAAREHFRKLSVNTVCCCIYGCKLRLEAKTSKHPEKLPKLIWDGKWRTLYSGVTSPGNQEHYFMRSIRLLDVVEQLRCDSADDSVMLACVLPPATVKQKYHLELIVL